MPKLVGVLFFVSVFGLVSCSSVQTSGPVNNSITTVFTAVEKAMSMGIHHRSVNQREFYSRPFLIRQDEKLSKSGLRERGLAKVIVLGESRPYTLEVEVKIERTKVKRPLNELVDADYAFQRYDERLASKLLNSILTIIEKGERDKNVIDDFRPF